MIAAGLGGEVELVERLGRWEPGEPQPSGETVFLRGRDLDVEEVVPELGVAELGRLGRLKRARELFGGGGELEVGAVAA